MKIYPLHIANQLNKSESIKQRVQMIFTQTSAKYRLFKYSSLLILVASSYVLFGFQSQWFGTQEIVRTMKELKPTIHDKSIFGSKGFSVTTPHVKVLLNKGSKVGFGFSEIAPGVYPKVELINGSHKVISSNESGGQTFFGFRCEIPQTGDYVLRIHNFKNEQVMHMITNMRNAEKKPASNAQEEVYREITLKQYETYFVSTAFTLSRDPKSLHINKSIYQKNKKGVVGDIKFVTSDSRSPDMTDGIMGVLTDKTNTTFNIVEIHSKK
ncbi:hypothetical protein BKI52_38520 [marine bacterium AO1-C]|nr:hypothetical protein BKI52_38520 [marine bacterium AO1-C]